jgi:hypothetical protein
MNFQNNLEVGTLAIMGKVTTTKIRTSKSNQKEHQK